jgi:ferrous iron transport protein B
MVAPAITIAPERARGTGPFRVALIGNPNSGKSTLFNALTGLRARTANFPGTTVEKHSGDLALDSGLVELLDLPGIYSLSAATTEERIARDIFLGTLAGQSKPDAAIVVADASNLARHLFLASQALEQTVPVIVALNMMDIAERHGLQVDPKKLSAELGCPVVPVVARSGQGVDGLKVELEKLVRASRAVEWTSGCKDVCVGCVGCPFQRRYDWTEGVFARVVRGTPPRTGRSDRIDRILTHPVAGTLAFFAVMGAMFFLIFSVAAVPMDLIDRMFAGLGSLVADFLPEGLWRSLVIDGIIGGVGGILVFLPQICMLFFFLALLDDSGYLARAAFVMDRLMRRVGLPGKAFVPLLSAHACAIPAIMSTRVIEDWRDRLVTILVAPLMSCSARIPVYTMVIALLFPHQPMAAASLFMSAYALGIAAALLSAFALKRTILPGESRPLVLELPDYRLPSARTAAFHMIDRAGVFVRQAGTAILAISMILWALAYFPRSEAPADVVALAAQGEALVQAGDKAAGQALVDRAGQIESRFQLEHSFAGRMGRFIEPVLRPLGFDWQISIGILTSFAAREVIVSTLAIVYGLGADRADDPGGSLYDGLRAAKRADGSPVFGAATCLSLLVFYVLAAQCLATQVITRRETNSLKWPLLQISYMSLLAYVAALAVHQAALWFGLT